MWSQTLTYEFYPAIQTDDPKEEHGTPLVTTDHIDYTVVMILQLPLLVRKENLQSGYIEYIELISLNQEKEYH
jgi:hypothetical protein